MSKKPLTVLLTIISILPCLAADAQPTGAHDDLRSQEEWLRYSNWERRQSRPQGAKKGEPKHENNDSSSSPPARVTTLPERPGSQTVEGGQFTVPNWAYQAPQPPQRPPEIIVGSPSFSFQSRIGTPWAFGLPGIPGWSSWHGYGMGSGGLYSGFARSRLGPSVIQTGPSPSSGNYYQPSTPNSASGNYYASGAPWQVPVVSPKIPRDYWGPQGSPFKQ